MAGENADSTAEVQAIVDDYASVLGAAAANPGSLNLSDSDYATLGVTGVDADGATLLNSILPGKSVSEVDTTAALQALADQAQAVVALAADADSAPDVSKADLEALGVTGITNDNSPPYSAPSLRAIAAV
jgi:hypothetical protein